VKAGAAGHCVRRQAHLLPVPFLLYAPGMGQPTADVIIQYGSGPDSLAGEVPGKVGQKA
jgi:hypothetical protein